MLTITWILLEFLFTYIALWWMWKMVGFGLKYFEMTSINFIPSHCSNSQVINTKFPEKKVKYWYKDRNFLFEMNPQVHCITCAHAWIMPSLVFTWHSGFLETQVQMKKWDSHVLVASAGNTIPHPKISVPQACLFRIPAFCARLFHQELINSWERK